MNEAPHSFDRWGRKRALVLAAIVCLALSAWAFVPTRRPTSGVKRTPAPAPLKPQPRARTNSSLDPLLVCLRGATSERVSNDA